MKNKTQLILATLCSVAPFASGIVYLDDDISGIDLIDNGVDQAPSYEIVSDLDLAAIDDGSGQFVLPAVVFVNNGATITIPAGTIMRGQPRVTGGTGDAPGALIVTEDGIIEAVGTASNPIVWTTANVGTVAAPVKYSKGDNSPTWLDPDPLNSPLDPQIGGANVVEQWGGVALLGKAPLNTAGNRSPFIAGRATLEGLPTNAGVNALYGGSDPNDNSGRMIYNTIRHNGDVLAAGSEIQGLTLGGVGYGTQLSYIEIYCSGDDGIEIFGGTSTLDHILISYAQDDGLDLDQGYSGMIQFLCAFGVDSTVYPGFGGNNIGEWDGDDYSEGDPDSLDSTGIPLTYVTFYNHTYMGSSNNNGLGLDADSGWGGNVYNSIVNNYPTGSGGLDYADGGFPGTNFADRWAAGTIDFSGINWFNAVPIDAEGLTVYNGGTDNAATDPQMVGNDQTPGNNDLAPIPQNAVAVIVAPSSGFGVGYTSTFFEPVTYKGAFDPSVTATLWTTTWTALNRNDVMPDRGDKQDVDGF